MSNSIHNSISKAGGDNTNPVNRKKNSCEVTTKQSFPKLHCRKCATINPFSYYAPILFENKNEGTCVCFECVESRGWIDPTTGDLKKGITL